MHETRSRLRDSVPAATVLDLGYYPGRGEHRPTSRLRKLEPEGHLRETTHNPTVWIGVDVNKETLDVCLVRSEGKPQSKTFSNTPAGHQKLLRWSQHLVGEAVCHVAMEATGAYFQEVAQFPVNAEAYISVLNPARVKYAGISLRQTNKTDPADAHTIAEYCRLYRPPLWKQALPEVRPLSALVRPLSALVRPLSALVRRLKSVQEMRVMEKNRQQLPGTHRRCSNRSLRP